MAWLRKEQHPGLLDAETLKHMKRRFGIFAAAILIIFGFPCGDHASIQLGGNAYAAPAASSNLDPIAPAAKSAKKLWVCPMHPDVVQDHPGSCPKCGMDLVEMEQPGAPQAAHGHGVHIDTATQQKLGVRLAAAKMQTLSQDIHAYGNVAVDESLVFNLSAKVEGVIKKLHINSVGQQVRAGQVLYEIFSPELLKSQNEYIELLKERDIIFAPMEAEDAHINGKGMPEDDMVDLRVNAAKRVLVRDRLLYADTGGELVESLIKTYKPTDVVEIRAPRSGVVTKIEVHEGSTIKPMDNLFSFVNLSRVWVDVPLYPDQLAWVKAGDEAVVKLPQSNAPGIKARLQLIPPLIDGATRTVQARLSVNNARLPVGAYVDVIIRANPHKALAIPRSAVMRTGKGDLVMLAEGGGHFTPVKVETGVETTDSIEIIDGLRAGDQVAVNGQFLLDAAASMSDAAERLHEDHNHDTYKH